MIFLFCLHALFQVESGQSTSFQSIPPGGIAELPPFQLTVPKGFVFVPPENSAQLGGILGINLSPPPDGLIINTKEMLSLVGVVQLASNLGAELQPRFTDQELVELIGKRHIETHIELPYKPDLIWPPDLRDDEQSFAIGFRYQPDGECIIRKVWAQRSGLLLITLHIQEAFFASHPETIKTVLESVNLGQSNMQNNALGMSYLEPFGVKQSSGYLDLQDPDLQDPDLTIPAFSYVLFGAAVLLFAGVFVLSRRSKPSQQGEK